MASTRDPFVTGDWTVTPARNLLVRGADEVRVEPRLMDVLVTLVDAAGQVVSKEQLMARVWADRHVTDDVLTVTIYALRKTLGDEAKRPRYIETVSRRGYRWIAPVALLAPLAAPLAARAPVAPVAPVPRRPRVPAVAAIAVMTLMVAVAGALSAVGPWRRASASDRNERRVGHVAAAEAHEAYLKGRFFLDQRSVSGWRQALDQFQRASALDPADPAAHAGLADTYSAMADVGAAPHSTLRPRAMEEAERALALDAQSAEGHEALGRARFLFDWDFDGAERSLTQAISRDPDFMPAHQAMAWVQSARGRSPAAIESARRARQLDPVNTARYTELAWVLVLGGRIDEALRELDRALQLNPRSFETLLMRGWACETAGQPDAAFAAYRNALRLIGLPPEALTRLDAVYQAEGLRGYYRGWLARLDQGAQAGLPMSETLRAQLYLRVGQPQRALEALERAYERREGALAWVNVEPGFAPIRADLRFQQLAARVRPAN